MDASLKCDLTVARQRQPLAYRTHKPREIRVTECRRCTAPEEYGLERRTRNIWRIRRRLDLVDEDIDIVMHCLLACEILEEAAVAAFLIAERDVNVDRTLIGRVRSLRHQLRPDLRLLRLVPDHALAARAGMHDALFRKGTAQRILRLRAKQPAACLLRECREFCLKRIHASTSFAAAMTCAKSFSSG